MDKTTKAFIESIISPLISHCQRSTQVSNSLSLTNSKQPAFVLKTYMQDFVNILLASQYMRQSRISNSSRVSQKKPSWNNNPKYESPSKPAHNQASHEKIKIKPPIPKIMKSPAKPNNLKIKNINSEKKINGGTKLTTDNNQTKQNNQFLKQSAKKTEASPKQSQKQLSKSNVFDEFEQLARRNNELLVEIRQGDKKQKSLNYVHKVNTPKSEYNNSKTASPNCRSFISESDNKRLMKATQVSLECELVKMPIS